MRIILCFVFLLFLCKICNAQVTIGSDEAPVDGALLQFKEIKGITNGDANSTRGVVMPRLTLTDLNSLVDITTGLTDTNELYTGLMIYNNSDSTVFCDYILPGLYVWNGTSWKALQRLGLPIVRRDYRKDDLMALQKIMNDNPDGKLSWSIDTTNLDNLSNYLLSGVFWEGIGCRRRVTGLTVARCSLTTLDVSALSALTRLDCSSNKLTSLDLNQNTQLSNLICFNNQLTSLDLTENKSLANLNCYSNQLTTLDLSQNTSLTTLDCSSNQLVSLNVAQNIYITELRCKFNQLTSLDITQMTALKSLVCLSNQLTSLDVTQNLLLKDITCSSNQLSSLDLTKNSALTYLSCFSNPTLIATAKSVKICEAVWDAGITVSPSRTSSIYDVVVCD